MIMSVTLSAQSSHSMVKIGKDQFEKSITLNNDPKNLSIFAVFDNKQNRHIRLNVSLITIKSGQKPIIKPIKLHSINGVFEAQVLALKQLDNKNILLITGSYKKKENEIILRLFSETGQLLKTKQLATNAFPWIKYFHFLYYGGNEFYTIYQMDSKRELIFTAIDQNLNTTKTQNYALAKTQYLERILVKNKKLYYIFKEAMQSMDELKSKHQMMINRYDLNTLQLEKSIEIKSQYHYLQNQYFERQEGIEIISLSSDLLAKPRRAVLCITKIDWETLDVKEKRTDFYVQENLSKLSERSYIKNRDNNVFTFLPLKLNPDKSYTIIFRLATEDITRFSSNQNGAYTSTEIFKDTFENCVVYKFDSALNVLNHFELNNHFTALEYNFNQMYRINQKDGDFNIRFFQNDSSKQLLVYNSVLDGKKNKLCWHTIKNDEITPEQANIVNDFPGKNCIYNLKDISEIAPGIFVITAKVGKKESYVLILNTN